jgi:hypothetical protein
VSAVLKSFVLFFKKLANTDLLTFYTERENRK